MPQITSDIVRDDFNDIAAVLFYARAAHFLGLWESERLLIERFFTDKSAPLLEAGCGAGSLQIEVRRRPCRRAVQRRRHLAAQSPRPLDHRARRRRRAGGHPVRATRARRLVREARRPPRLFGVHVDPERDRGRGRRL